VKSILRRRPSPALVVACIALFLSLGGVSYGLATGSIDSREVKNNSLTSSDIRNNTIRTFDIRNNAIRGFDIRNSTIQGRDVALNTLTGADISEKDLAQVPSAAKADDAGTVGGVGVKKIFLKQPSGTGIQAVYNGGFFVLGASCTGGSAALQLDPAAGGPETSASWQSINAADAPDFGSDTDLQAGDAHDLLNAGTDGSASVTVSTTDGRVATVVVSAQSAPAFSGENVCAVRGTVLSG
jgi:hypothetical protein